MATASEGGTAHRYLSTACLHGRHDHCQARTNHQGEPKEPGTCKWCAAPCICECHHADHQ